MYSKISQNIKTIDITNGELYPILSALNIGVMITNAEGEIVFYNPVHAEMDGLPSQRVIGQKVTEVYDFKENSSLVMRCLRTGRPIVECPVIYKTHNGQIVDSIHNVFPLTKSGKITGVISFVKDYHQMEDPADPDDRKASPHVFSGDTDFSLDDIIGSNVSFLESINRARMAAKTDSPVLIYGETGTGKELFAQSIHNLSARKNARYIAVNCAAIPENLLEGILFGTSKGAFTGALDKPGLFERANGGTLFLDEVNSMSREMQPKLLRAIQEKRVCRIGSHRELKLELKIISSINTTPEQAMEAGNVRRDLLYRLSVVYISLPPLRSRRDDVSLLTRHFINKYNGLLNKNVLDVSNEVKRNFDEYDWPGNVRELENIIEGALNMVGRDQLIETWHLMPGLRISEKAEKRPFKETTRLQRGKDSLSSSKDEERRASFFSKQTKIKESDKGSSERDIIAALSDADGNITDAAVIMGISRQTLYRKIKALDIAIPKKINNRQRQMIVENLKKFKGNITKTAKALGISRQLLSYRMRKMGIDRSQLPKT